MRKSLALLRYDLSGKDWLTVAEASHYFVVPESNFRKHATAYGSEPRRFMGKQLYEKAAIYRSIGDASKWPPEVDWPAGKASSPELVAAMVRLARHEKRRGKP